MAQNSQCRQYHHIVVREVRSHKPRVQRKNLFQAPSHIRYKQFSAPLSAELKKTHSTGAFPVRTGDTVKIIRGDRKGFEGKVARVDRNDYKIFIEGVTREKVSGTTTPTAVHPSKVLITHLSLDDKWRREALKRKSSSESKTRREKATEEEKPLKGKESV